MAYKITGTKTETARLIVLKESDWSVESTTVISGSGNYEVSALESSDKKSVIARKLDGEIIGYGDINPIFYDGGIDNYTKLCLHMDDTNLSDSSLSEHTTTLLGDISRSDTQSKFGGYSAYFDGVNNKITVADSDEFYFGTNEFTIDFWLKWETVPTSVWTDLFSQIPAPGISDCSVLLGTWTTGLLNFVYYLNGSTSITINSSGFSWNTSDWFHIAIVRDKTANQIKIFVNGTLRGSASIDSASSIYNSAQPFSIGGRNGTDVHDIHGYMDEFRISKGIARWTSNFTPQVEAYYL